MRHAFDRAGDITRIRTHGDCHASNVLWTPSSGNNVGGPHFVDLDDSRMAPAIQDFWMLVSGDRHAMGQQLGKLLNGYEDFMEFDDRELHLFEALRTLRLLHYCAWLARRWDDPAFPLAFPWFNTQRLLAGSRPGTTGASRGTAGTTARAPMTPLHFDASRP